MSVDLKAIQGLVQTDPTAAITQLDDLLTKIDPLAKQSYNLHILRAQACLGKPDYLAAAQGAENALKINGLAPQMQGNALKLKGRAEQFSQNFEEASKSYQAAFDTFEGFKTDVQLITSLGTCLLKCNPQKKQEAIKYLKLTIEINPNSDAGVIAIGEVANLLSEEKQYEEAVKYYVLGIDAASKQNNSDKLSLLYTSKGNAEFQQQRLDEAMQSFQKALEYQKNNHSAQDGLGIIIYNQMIQAAKAKDYEKTLKFSEQVLESKPDEIEAWYCKALSLENQNKKSESIAAYLEVVKRNPDRFDALLNLGTLYHVEKKFDLAIEYYVQAVKIEPKAEIFSNLGEAYKELNRFDEAFQSFDKAIATDKTNIVSYCNRAQLNLKKGNKQNAMVDLKEVDLLIKDPNNTKDLKEATINYIKGSVKQILEIENYFQKEKKLLEEQLNKQDQNDPAVMEIMKQIEDMQNKKDQQSEQALNNVSQSTSSTKSDIMSLADMQKQMKEMMDKINSLAKQKEVLKVEIKKEEEKIVIVQKEVDEETELLNLVGADKAAKVKTTYREWLVSYKDGYDYSKAFYWTFINYCDAQRMANTGVIKTDSTHAVDSTTRTAVKVTSAILDFGKSVPVFGSIFGVLNSAVNGFYSAYEQKKEEDKRMAILKVIQENQDANSQEEWSMLVALAAQEIAMRKKLVFVQKNDEKINPPPQKTLSKIKAWLEEQVKNVKAAAFGQSVDLFDSVGGEEACADMIILLGFIQKNYQEMVSHRSQTLDKTLADIVYCKEGITPQFQSMLDAVQFREEVEHPKKKEAAQTDQACTCNLI